MIKKKEFLKLFLFFCCSLILIDSKAVNYTFGSPSVSITPNTGCTVGTYTFSQLNPTCNPLACTDAQINAGASVVINFPIGIDASTITTGNFNGSAITFITITTSSVTFNAPVQVLKNTNFTILLANVTNTGSVSGMASVTCGNNSGGTNSNSNYSVTIGACPPPPGSSFNSLKAVVFDFEGYDLASTNLLSGGYRYNDVSYVIAANPGANGDMIGQRVLEINWNFGAGYGGWGRGYANFFELDASADYINFYFYNPTTNSKNASINVIIQEDDNADNVYNGANDDEWIRNISINRLNAWQLISVPLNTLIDNNGGGNGIFDAGFTFNSRVFNVQFQVVGLIAGDGPQKYFVDMVNFSEGVLPTGATILDLPPKNASDFCMIGGFSSQADINGRPDLVPAEIEGYFNPPDTRKLCIVNHFLPFTFSGTSPNIYPGVEVQNLISNGYIPMITWEPFFSAYAFADPIQPNLAKINAGNYDAYIDNFANQIKTYTGTVLIRLMHEMDGNWYPWCIATNGGAAGGATAYINAFRRFVNRFNALNVTNVKWVWCVNSEPIPQEAYNYFPYFYPGDGYVDIVGTDIYNFVQSGTPEWKSFRSLGIPSYYYLYKNFPTKPIYIPEIGCRERQGSELATSETKAEWTTMWDKELESQFAKTRAIIAFSLNKEHDWRLNSSLAAATAFRNSFWNNPYYSNCTLNTSLPLSLLSFNAKYNPLLNETNLTWEVVDDKSNAVSFIVQHSSNGIDFIDLGEVTGQLYGQENTTYNFTHKQPFTNVNFYRIIVLNGNELEWKSYTISVEKKVSTNLKIYPNPFSNQTTIELVTGLNGNYTLQLFSIEGKLIKAYSILSNTKLSIGEDFPIGIYYYKLINDIEQQYGALIKK